MKKVNTSMLILFSILFLVIVQISFSTPAPCKWLDAVWEAGDLLTFVGTLTLGIIAFRQNEKLLEINNQLQHLEKSKTFPRLFIQNEKDFEIKTNFFKWSTDDTFFNKFNVYTIDNVNDITHNMIHRYGLKFCIINTTDNVAVNVILKKVELSFGVDIKEENDAFNRCFSFPYYHCDSCNIYGNSEKIFIVDLRSSINLDDLLKETLKVQKVLRDTPSININLLLQYKNNNEDVLYQEIHCKATFIEDEVNKSEYRALFLTTDYLPLKEEK